VTSGVVGFSAIVGASTGMARILSSGVRFLSFLSLLPRRYRIALDSDPLPQ